MRERFIIPSSSPILPLALSAALLGGLPVQAADALEEARTSLEQWVGTRQLISKTTSEWQGDKELIQQTIHLFERELKSVEEQMAGLDTNSTQVMKEMAEASASLKSSIDGLDRARQFASEFEGQLTKLLPRLPAPLLDLLQPLLNKLPSDAAKTEMLPTARVQVLAGLLNEIDKFNTAVTIFSEKRTNNKGEEVAVETVYVGLGAAYFVNEANDFAGTGSPSAQGWEWENKPELASSVREVIRIYRNERTARFVALPAVIR